MDATHDLAQVNVMRLKAPLDSPALAAFVAAIEPINAEAEERLRRLRAEGPTAFAFGLRTAFAPPAR